MKEKAILRYNLLVQKVLQPDKPIFIFLRDEERREKSEIVISGPPGQDLLGNKNKTFSQTQNVKNENSRL